MSEMVERKYSVDVSKRQVGSVVVTASSYEEAVKKAAAMLDSVKWTTAITFESSDILNTKLPIADHAQWQEHWRRD